SDNAATLTTLLRTEARREQPAGQLPANLAGTPSGNTGSDIGRYGGAAGGHHMGGMGGGSHGRHHGGASASQKPGSGQDTQAQTQFALPSLLEQDSVLLVQEQAHSVEVQLDNGERLD